MKREEAIRILLAIVVDWKCSVFTTSSGLLTKVMFIASDDEFWKIQPSTLRILGLMA